MFFEQFCAFLSAFKLDTFSVSHGNSLYAGIPHSLLYFTLAQGPESARKSGASAFALLVSCCACIRFVFRPFVIYLLKVVGFSGIQGPIQTLPDVNPLGAVVEPKQTKQQQQQQQQQRNPPEDRSRKSCNLTMNSLHHPHQ